MAIICIAWMDAKVGRLVAFALKKQIDEITMVEEPLPFTSSTTGEII